MITEGSEVALDGVEDHPIKGCKGTRDVHLWVVFITIFESRFNIVGATEEVVM